MASEKYNNSQRNNSVEALITLNKLAKSQYVTTKVSSRDKIFVAIENTGA
jgi:hypothetical protein